MTEAGARFNPHWWVFRFVVLRRLDRRLEPCGFRHYGLHFCSRRVYFTLITAGVFHASRMGVSRFLTLYPPGKEITLALTQGDPTQGVVFCC